MEFSPTKKLAQHIFRLLKVTEIVFPIGRTNKGNLGLKFSQANEDFEIFLDAVPLPTKDMLVDDNNIELKRMLEKYWFEQEKGVINLENMRSLYNSLPKESFIEIEPRELTDAPPKKRGRPAGTKNKVK